MIDNENPTPEQPAAVPDAAEPAKPARKRAPRKTAAKTAANTADVAADVAAATDAQSTDAQAADAPKPARKTRAKKTAPAESLPAETTLAEASVGVDVGVPAALAEQASQDGAETLEASAAQAAASQDRPADGQRQPREPRQRREARPNRGKQIPVSDEPVAPLAFDDIIAGVLDAEDAPDAPGFPKRVLPPQPELPKLHKVLAQAGLGSRLEMERLIADGGISVNNQPAHVGQRIQWGDKVRVKGKLLRLNIAPPMPRVLAYHKPAGEVVTHDDPQNRPTVFRRLPRLQQGKWQSVGRLDLNTEGLLLLTSSGELANCMMHPSFGLEREYAARVLGALSAEEKEQLLAGIELEDGPAQFGSIRDGGGEGANQWYQVTINEGRNREVRRMFETLGHAVSRLIRTRYGVVQLPRGLRRGFYMELGERDVKALMEAAGMDTSVRQGPLTRIDPKREQARARGLRRAQPKPEALDGDQQEFPDQAQMQGYDAQAAHSDDAEQGQQRFRRTPFGRKRPVGGQRPSGQNRDGQRPSRFEGRTRPEQQGRQDRQPRAYDADDEFSQRGVSHESPFEAKASRKRIFSSATQVPDIIKAQRAGNRPSGAGGRSSGGQGGIDPMRTSLGFIGGDSYRNSSGGNGNRRGGGAGRKSGGASGRNSGGGFGGQRSGGGRGRGR